MKKLSIVLVAFLFIGITNVNAQTTDSQTDTKITEKICAETGKVCSETCENKKDGTCCNGKKKKSCSKSEKRSCSKSSEKKSCSKKEKAVRSKNTEDCKSKEG